MPITVQMYNLKDFVGVLRHLNYYGTKITNIKYLKQKMVYYKTNEITKNLIYIILNPKLPPHTPKGIEVLK